MVGIYVFMGITIAFSIATAYAQEKGVFGIRFLIKCLASSSFMIMGFLALYKVKRIDVWQIGVIIGLLAGLIGDVFHATNGIVETKFTNPLQLSGVVFFWISHLIYVMAFNTLFRNFNSWFFIIIAGIPVIVYILIIKKKIPCHPQAIVPMLFYALIIALMLAIASNILLESKASTQGVIIFVGALLFVLSDLLLGFYYFFDFKDNKKEKSIVAFIYMPVYYIAHTLFALSITL